MLVVTTTTIADTLSSMIKPLSAVSSTARLDAELLLSACLGQSRTYLYTYPEVHLLDAERGVLLDYLQRRLQGEPVAYILGCQAFWSLEFSVTTDTLIPRPETEHLIEWALQHLPAEEPLRLADLGTGSGAIAIALAHERPRWTIHATDHSAAALRIAMKNAQRYGLNNIEFYWGDWCQALPTQQYHAIISNPPYIEQDDPHLSDLTFEPLSALSSGTDGLQDIQKIIAQAPHYLFNEACLVLEHGYRQSSAIASLLKNHPFRDITCHCDLASQPRFITAIKQ